MSGPSILGSIVGALVLVVAASGCPAQRPCTSSAQCEDGASCVRAAGRDVGACVSAGEGEGEGSAGEGEGSPGEGEGEGSPGEGEGEGEGVAVSVVSVDVGQGFACIVDTDQKVQCWGSDSDGQLGREVDFGHDDVPHAVPNLAGVEKLAVAQAHSCAIGELGGGARTVACWGDATQGNLGQINGVTPFTLIVPNVDINFLRGAVDVDNDADNNGGVTCIANDAGHVTCFGPQMVGFDPSIGAPVDLPALDGATRVFVSLEAICADTPAGVVCTHLATGAVTHFGCADGAPCPALGGAARFDVSVEAACTLTGTDVACAGDNVFGIVDPQTPGAGDAPFHVVTTAVDFGLGLQHGCAIALDGRAVCWGRALELSTGFDESDPALFGCGSTVPGTRCGDVLTVPGTEARRFSNIAVRRTGACARESNGDGVVCWGNSVAAVRTTFVQQ